MASRHAPIVGIVVGGAFASANGDGERLEERFNASEHFPALASLKGALGPSDHYGVLAKLELTTR